MTKVGKKSVLDTIEGLSPRGSTNLWDGLRTGMDLLNNASSLATNTSSRLSTLFILTDGMPNINPPRGHIPMLKSYLDAHPATRPFSISTFGFGYDLDSPLLLDIAQVGGGGYSFIPDSGMVGTVFVHSVANAYATYAPRASLDVEIMADVAIKVEGGMPVTKTSWGVKIDAGDIQFGQARDYVLMFPGGTIPSSLTATATFHPYTSSEPLKTDTVSLVDCANPPDLAGIEYHSARLKFVEALFATKTPTLDAARQSLSALKARITSSPLLSAHAPAQALAQDISGQGFLGLDPTHFARWGRHYFPSLARSHQRQQCGNFKDPGLQVYGQGSRIFEEERDELDKAFDALPPPKPSVSRRSHYGGSPGKAPVGVASMAMYRKAAGPCFAGSSLVLLTDGTHTRVEDLKRGMAVMTLLGPRSVAVIVKTHVPSGEALLCSIGEGLVITPWHPMLKSGAESSTWVFPKEVAEPEMVRCEAVYSVLLLPSLSASFQQSSTVDADAHTLSIGGVWCTALGHGITSPSDTDIRAHEFLGSYDRVLLDLSTLNGFESGEGVVECVGTERGRDGRICGFLGVEAVADKMELPGMVGKVACA